MSNQPRITQSAIARILGLNQATVSLALRGHPSIPRKTQELVKRTAKESGYVPDPMLTALAAYRYARRRREVRCTLTWLSQTTSTFKWRDVPHFAAYFSAAEERAAYYGYRIEVLDLGSDHITWKRAASVIKSRGCEGILICPQPFPQINLSEFPWRDFSVVTFGHTIKTPRLHTVAAAQASGARLCVQKLVESGRRRIGLYLNDLQNRKSDYNYFAGYITAWEIHGLGVRIPPCADGNLGAWIHAHRLDAVVACDKYFIRHLAESGLQAPQDIAVVCPMLASEDDIMAGVWEDNSQIGRVAVDSLVSMIRQGERGVPSHPQRILVEGIWVNGRTFASTTKAGSQLRNS